MTTVTKLQTPTEQLIAAAQKAVTVTDKRGRKLTLRYPAFLAQFRLVEVAGQSASNEVFMRMIQPLLFVGMIDNEEIPQPKNKAQLDALISQLDEDGFEAVTNGIFEHFTPKVDKNLSPEEAAAEIRKKQGEDLKK